MSFKSQHSGPAAAARGLVAGLALGVAACAPAPGVMPQAEGAAPLVTQPVDLQVQLLGAPSPSFSSEAITLTATARNASSDVAAALQLVLTVPASAQVQHQPEGPGWSCTQVAADGSATCTRPEQDLLSESEVWLAVLPDVTATMLTATAALSGENSDPDPSNNRATVTVPIQYDAASYRTPALGGGGWGCRLGGPAPASAPTAGLVAAALAVLLRRRATRG